MFPQKANYLKKKCIKCLRNISLKWIKTLYDLGYLIVFIIETQVGNHTNLRKHVQNLKSKKKRQFLTFIALKYTFELQKIFGLKIKGVIPKP